jgi:hypothetical protein
MRNLKSENSVRVVRLFLLTCLIGSMAIACGKAGPPRPPEDFAPSPVSKITATTDSEGVTINWEAPKTTVQNLPLTDLESYSVLRSEFEFDRYGPASELTEISAIDSADNILPSLSFKDSSVVEGNKYKYQIVAINSAGVEVQSVVSAIVNFSGTQSSSANPNANIVEVR